MNLDFQSFTLYAKVVTANAKVLRKATKKFRAACHP
jgi:hypothetical protein